MYIGCRRFMHHESILRSSCKISDSIMLSQQMNMDDPEAGCRVSGRCIFCFSEEQFVVQFECNRTVCERCYINRMKSSSKVIQCHFLSLLRSGSRLIYMIFKRFRNLTGSRKKQIKTRKYKYSFV